MHPDPFDDAALYDWEYRRRREDVRFYRTLAGERGGPILDLGCGTGRLLIPLVRDGHHVVGVDRAAEMLARACTRLSRLAPPARRRALLLRGDIRRLPVAPTPRFAFSVAAFHTVQHLLTDGELVRFLRQARAALIPGGWLAFDVFVPSARFLARAPRRRWDHTPFRHPITARRLVYSMSQRLLSDGPRRLLMMTFHYQPVDARGRPVGNERHVRLVHRLFSARRIESLLRKAGLSLIASWGGFDGRPLGGDNTETEQQIFLARRP